MSLYNYEVGLRISAQGYPFYALVQAAMREADTDNLEKLKAAFPDQWKDLQERYHAPAGKLAGEA